MKLLIFIPSPRNIPEVEDAHALIQEDKIWIKYVGYDYDPNPYQRAVNYFLNHPEYTHFAISPDDLIVDQNGIDILKKDIQERDLKCVMGICNVNKDLNQYAMTEHKVHPDRDKRKYDFMHGEDFEGKTLFKVGWCGTPFAILERSLVEKLEWVGDLIDDNNKGKGIQAFDVGLCYQLQKMKVPIYVDTRAKFFHKRYGGEILVGKRQPDVWLDIVGKPRILNEAVYFKAVKKAYDEFEKEGGMRMAWVDNFFAELMKYLEFTEKTTESIPFKETLEVFKKQKGKRKT